MQACVSKIKIRKGLYSKLLVIKSGWTQAGKKKLKKYI